MDPISLIIGALVAGANTALQEAGGQAVKDAYQVLKTKIQDWFSSRKVSEGEIVLKRHEEKPETWQEPLKELLIEAEAVKSQEIVAAAQKLMEIAKPYSMQNGKFNINIQGGNVKVEGSVQADSIGSLTQNFGTKPEEDE